MNRSAFPSLRLFPSFAVALLLAAAPLASADFRIVAPAGSLPPDANLSLQRERIESRTSETVVDRSVNADGSLDLDLDQPPGYYILEIEGFEAIKLAPDSGQTLRLAIDPDAEPPSLLVSGSPDTDLLQAYEDFRKASLARLVYPARAEVKAAREANASEDRIAELTQREVDAYQAHLRELNDFAIERLGESVALYYASLRWTTDYRGEELAALASRFQQARGDLAIAQEMSERIQKSLKIAIGQPAPPLEGTDLDGTVHRLADYRGRYVLVDFWASWCPPCRVENRHYNKLVERLSDDDFVIFSVNLDTDERRWHRAAQQDQVSWIQISDLQGLKSPLAAAYDVNALPASFLLDRQGRILAKDLRGPELDRKLRELGVLSD